MGWGIGLGRGLLRGTCGIVFLLVCGLVVVAFLGRVSWWEIMEAEGKGRGKRHRSIQKRQRKRKRKRKSAKEGWTEGGR